MDAARVDIYPSVDLPVVKPWEITVAAAVLGRPSSVTVLGGGAAAGSVKTLALPAADRFELDETRTARGLLAAWRAAGDEPDGRAEAVRRFLDRRGNALAEAIGLGPSEARAAESVRFLAAVLGGCLKSEQIDPADVREVMSRSGRGFGLGRHPARVPYVSIDDAEDTDQVVRQIGVFGTGQRKHAVAIVARAALDPAPPPAAAQQRMLDEVALWIDENIHVSGRYTARC